MRIRRIVLHPSRASRMVFLAAVITLFVGCNDADSLRSPAAPTTREASKPAFELVSTIPMSSNRHDPDRPGNPFVATEIYLIDPDATNPRRLTDNAAFDLFATLSPDGKKIMFESNRLRTAGERFNTSDLFIMNTDGTEQTFVARGSSATWSPDGKYIAYHASASGVGLPIRGDVGAATSDSDIFILNVDDVLSGTAVRRNLTNSPDAIDDDADWSPDGQRIVFTSHLVTDSPINSVTAEIYVMDPSGAGAPVRLTNNTEEERAPSWSPDGSRIAYMGHMGVATFQLCVMNADGSGQTQLTSQVALTTTWSPDGGKIVFHRPTSPTTIQLFTINADGTGEMQLTGPPGSSGFANWGELRVHSVP